MENKHRIEKINTQTFSSAKTSGVVLPDAQIMNTNPNFSLYLAFHSANSYNRWGKSKVTDLHVTDVTNTVDSFPPGRWNPWLWRALRIAPPCTTLNPKRKTNVIGTETGQSTCSVPYSKFNWAHISTKPSNSRFHEVGFSS
jgi:hypothetical protein